MTARPAAWVAVFGAALLVFVGAVALTVFGLGRAPGATSTPTAPGMAQASPTTADGLPSGTPSTPGSNATPSPEPTQPSTDKIGPPHSVDPKQLTGYGWPLKRPWITSRFAPRDFGTFILVDGVGYHDGLDLATHCGDKVFAAHDGRVLVADRTFNQYLGYEGHPENIYNLLAGRGRADALAIAVVIDDGNGYRSQYMHLKAATVEPGQYVHKGDQIGVEGMTGAATGCHVHYSLIRMDGDWQGIIPRLWKYGYPERIREHVNPIEVLPWGDLWAPLRLYNQIYPPSPSPTPSLTPSPTPTATGSPGPTQTPSPSPTATPSASPTPKK